MSKVRKTNVIPRSRVHQIICIYIYVCKHVYVYIYVCKHVYVCIYIYMYVHVLMYIERQRDRDVYVTDVLRIDR